MKIKSFNQDNKIIYCTNFKFKKYFLTKHNYVLKIVEIISSAGEDVI